MPSPTKKSRRLARQPGQRRNVRRLVGRQLRAEHLEPRHLLTGIPLLESNPGAAASLYLDFDGHYEATWGAYSGASVLPFDSDGDTANISDEEARYIEEVWRIVSEDYAPFNINVTTIEPAALAAGADPALANGVALRVALGAKNFSVSPHSGIAYRDSFTNYLPNVAFVFTQSSSGNLNSSLGVGNYASHEAGHSFGLAHYDGQYDYGDGWQAIMGGILIAYSPVGAYWHTAVNDEGNFQDDMATIARPENGFGYRGDDHGDQPSSASLLTHQGNQLVATGLIATGDDHDLFSVPTTLAQNLEVSVVGSEIDQNLDVVLEYLAADGTVLATVDPTNSPNATLFVEAGGYVAVRSTGQYGRVGRYTLTVRESSAGIYVDANQLTTRESGESDSFTVSLKSKPTSNVIIPVTSSDPSEGVTSTAQLTFTPENWYQPQIVTLTGMDDSQIDGNREYSIVLGATVSDDPIYTGVSAPQILAINVTDDEPITLLSESFEGSEWGGRWVEDSQNDWFRSSQRASDGSRSAEVDGRANNATLTLANAIDLSPYSKVRLTFSWYLESSWDSGEYIALDLFDGSSWTEVRRLSGNVDPENAWRGAFITIDQRYLGEDFRMRFRSSVSGSDEDGNVDNIQLQAIELANQAPAASGAQFAANEDTPLHVTAPGVLVGATDPDGDSLSAVLISDTSHGELTLNLDGSFTYMPSSDFHGSDSFAYQASDGANRSQSVTVALNVAPLNDAPTAISQSVIAKQNTATAITLSANDIDGDTLSYSVESFPAHGVITGAAPDLIYTPQTGFAGTDSFTFRVHDGNASSQVVTVSVTVASNTPPSAVGQSVTTSEDASLNILLSGADADGDGLTYTLVGGPANGTLIGTAPQLTYTPAANYHGSDSLTFQVSDGTATSNLATIVIEVLPVNDAPLAHGKNVATDEDQSLDLTLSGSDFDGDALTYSVVAEPTHGTLTGAGVNLTYVPNEDFAGTDSFTFRASDGSLSSGTATIFVTVNPVNDAPAATDDSFSLAASVLSVAAPGVLSNDNDPDRDTLAAVLISGPSHGELSLAGDGSFTYTPTGGYTGTDSFVYRITDGELFSDPVSVLIEVAGTTTRFYVPNDASSNRTYEYGSNGEAIESYNLSSGNASPRGAASDADGAKIWIADANRRVYVYDSQGGLQGWWSADSLSSRATVQGVATDGTDVWIVDSRSDRVYRYSGAAGRLSGSQSASSSFRLSSSNSNPTGITTDGTYLWVTQDSSTDRVFKYTLNGSLAGSWIIDAGNRYPSGLTIDPANGSDDIWIVDRGSDRVYQYSGARSRTSGSQSASAYFDLASGNTNPQGIADPPALSNGALSSELGWSLPSDQLASRKNGHASRDAETARASQYVTAVDQVFGLTTGQKTDAADFSWTPLHDYLSASRRPTSGLEFDAAHEKLADAIEAMVAGYLRQ